MFDKFLDFVKENKLIKKNDRILVGVSGGIDSVVLLDMLAKLQKNLQIQLAIAHVNYGLRHESDRDNEFARELAKKHNVPFFEKKVKISGANVEEKARDIRYNFFHEIREQENVTKIAVAHHKNDLVETFFLNVSRGSGLHGMVSMRPKNGYIIRPLLFATRAQIEDYTRRNKLKFVEDVTNRDLRFKRNLIRHKLIPQLEEENPDFVNVLTREIEDLRELESYLDEITEKQYKKLATKEEGKTVLKVKELKKLDIYLQSEVLRRGLNEIKGDLRDISRKNIKDILKLTKDVQGTKEVRLPQGLLARRVYDKLELAKVAKSPLEKPKSTRLSTKREAVFGKWKISLGKSEGKMTSGGKNLVFLNIPKTPTLKVRCRKPGDRIAIGQGKTKSLQDIFVDAKVPKEERGSYPVVVNEKEEVVWIPGLRVNENFKAKGSKKSLKIEAKT